MNDLPATIVALDRVYGGEYSNEALGLLLVNAEKPAFATKLFLGVLERDTEFEYAMSVLAAKRPKRELRTLIKAGMYLIKYMDVKNYAAVSGVVACAAEVQRGFVNAVLRRFAKEGVKPPADELELLAYQISKPLWLVEKLARDFDKQQALQMLDPPPFELEHIRFNGIKRPLSGEKNREQDAEQDGEQNRLDGDPSPAGGLFVRNTPQLRELFNQGAVTIQSLCSVYAAQAVVEQVQSVTAQNQNAQATSVHNTKQTPQTVLDLCAAPGGKACYIAENLPGAHVTACDIHPHRVELIKKYAARMGVKNITPMRTDATVFNPQWEGKFDAVLCDVPCTGLGVIRKKPDILLRLRQSDIAQLAQIQVQILGNALKYVKSGGAVVYCTCTVTKEENEDVTRAFADSAEIQAERRYTADGNGHDGFYICTLTGNKRG